MEDLIPIFGQLLVQLVYAGMYLIAHEALNDGMDTFVYVTYRHIIATIVIAPFAFFLERNKRPPLTIKTFLQLNLLALIGITINQNLYYAGLAITSSTFASTLTNLIPAITFVIASLLGMETMNMKSIRGQAKIMGTFCCVGGALIMTLVKGPALKSLRFHKPHAPLFLILDEVVMSGLSKSTWVLGSVLVFLSNICWSSWMILQAWVVRDYPPQLSLTAWMCFMATIQSAVVAVICAEHSAWKVAWDIKLLTNVYSGIFGSAFAFFVQSWCVKKKGPVFATAFSPLSTVLVAILETIFLHVYLHVGSLVGMILVFGGLYCLLWGKARDGEIEERENGEGRSNEDEEAVREPLLRRYPSLPMF